MENSAAVVLAIAAALGYFYYSFFYANSLAARKRALAHIPVLRFEENDTPERYMSETRSLLKKGYEKYLKNGVPFQMHNPVGELGNQVIMPLKYLDEVKRAPRSMYSFESFSEKLFLLKYFNSPAQTDAVTYAIKLDINRNLDKVVNGLWSETEQHLKDVVGPTGQKAVSGGELTCSIVSRTMSYVLVGPELSQNPEWQKIAIETTFAIVEASLGLRSKYTPNWRWLAKWQDGTATKLNEMRRKAKELLRPLYNERRQALKEKDESSFYDSIYWIMTKKNADTSLDGIVEQQLFLTLASIHTTAGILHSILFDWIDHPEYHDEIKAEINETLAEVQASGGQWTIQRVSAMKKLDSFMKESSRVNPGGFLAVQRYALKTHAFKDGFVLPAGTVFHFPSDAVHQDPEFYPEPEKFDAYRFLKLRETIDPNQFHFGYVSDMTLNWGAGAHACPGRFLATLVMKFALIQLITRYDVAFEDGLTQTRRPEFCVDNSRREDPTRLVALKAQS